MKKLFQRMDQGSKEPSTGHTSYIGKVFLVGRHTVTVEDTIAEGGFALVFLAKASGGVRYALKRLCVNNEHDLQVARNEINILKSVNGVKTIVGLVDYQITASGSSGVHEVLMLMTYHKRPLLHLLNDRLTSGLTEAEVLKIFCDVCDAVARLHHSNPPVIHRDLKVENILCGADGGYVLCDFGSATCESVCPLQSGVPAVEEELGRYTTLAYRAPEMVDLYAGHTISTKADIWALGCLLYKLCFFTLPFGESPLAITSGSFTFPAEYPVKYSPALLAFIRYLLTPSPDTRPDIFQTAAVAARLGGVPSSVLANPNNSVVPTEEQLLALLREAPSSGGGNTAPSASRPPAAAGVRSSQHHMEVGGTSVAPRQRPKPQQHVTASSVGAVPPLPPLQPPPHTTPPPTLPGAPPKRAAPGRDESVAMHHHHYPQQHHHHQQQAQVLPEGKRASPSDAAALQQENSPVVSFPPSELFGSSFPEPARPTSHSPADADASPHDEEHAIPPDQNEAFFPPSGKVATSEVGCGDYAGPGVLSDANSGLVAPPAAALPLSSSTNLVDCGGTPSLLSSGSPKLTTLPSHVTDKNRTDSDFAVPLHVNSSSNVSLPPGSCLHAVTETIATRQADVTAPNRPSSGHVLTPRTSSDSLLLQQRRGASSSRRATAGHVRSSSCIESAVVGRVKARSSADPSAAGHVRVGSSSSLVSLPLHETLNATSTQDVTQKPPVAPRTTLIKANNPFLKDMTPEELAMANLELAAEDQHSQEEDLLNFNEIPSAVSERNKQASVQIMQMFSATPASDSNVTRLPQGLCPGDHRRLHLPPKPSMRSSEDTPPMLPPKPGNTAPQVRYRCASDPAAAARGSYGALQTYGNFVPDRQAADVSASDYQNINYGLAGAVGSAAAAAPQYDTLTLLRHQQLVQQQQHPQQQQQQQQQQQVPRQRQQQRAEDWLMSQMPS